MVGSLSLVSLATGMSGCGRRVSGPVGKESTFLWPLIVSRASNCSSLQLLQGSLGAFSETHSLSCRGRAYLSYFLLLDWELGNAGPESPFPVERES